MVFYKTCLFFTDPPPYELIAPPLGSIDTSHDAISSYPGPEIIISAEPIASSRPAGDIAQIHTVNFGAGTASLDTTSGTSDAITHTSNTASECTPHTRSALNCNTMPSSSVRTDGIQGSNQGGMDNNAYSPDGENRDRDRQSAAQSVPSTSTRSNIPDTPAEMPPPYTE